MTMLLPLRREWSGNLEILLRFSVISCAKIKDINNDGKSDAVFAPMATESPVCVEARASIPAGVEFQRGGQINCVMGARFKSQHHPDVLAGSNDSYVYCLEGNITVTPVELCGFSLCGNKIESSWNGAQRVKRTIGI